MLNPQEVRSHEQRYRCFAVHNADYMCPVDRDAIPGLMAEGRAVWVDILAPNTADTVWLRKVFGFHALALSDLLNNNVRPKQERYGDQLFVVFGAVNLNPGENLLDTINLNIFLTEQYVVTAHGRPLKSMGTILSSSACGPDWLTRGTDHVAYRLLDGIIDEYVEVIDEMEAIFDDLEYRVFDEWEPNMQEEIFRQKRRLTFLRKTIAPKRDALRELVYTPFPMIKPETQTHLRDVLDHVMRVADNVDSFRDLAGSLMDSHMLQVSNRMNEVMKLMSIIATVMLPLSFLTGIFGMNFDRLPGLHSSYGFWVLVGFMVAMVSSMLWYFRRKDYL